MDWAPERKVALDAAVSAAGAFTRLLRAVGDGSRPAIGRWTIGDVAAHVSHVYAADTAAAGGAEIPFDDLWAVTDFNDANLRNDPERDLNALADRIDGTVRQFASVVESAPDDARAWWLGRSRLPLSAVASHVVHEAVVHGVDVARAAGRPFRIDPAHAALSFTGLAVPLISQLDPTTFVNAEAARGVRARFDMRLRGQARLVFAFDDGRLSVEEPGAHPPDCVVSVDPVAGLLVSWKRMGLARAVLTGRVAAWGRRPWLAMTMPKLLRNP